MKNSTIQLIIEQYNRSGMNSIFLNNKMIQVGTDGRYKPTHLKMNKKDINKLEKAYYEYSLIVHQTEQLHKKHKTQTRKPNGRFNNVEMMPYKVLRKIKYKNLVTELNKIKEI